MLDGIFHTVWYGEMLVRLDRDHPGSAYFYYFDIPLEETVRRHVTRDKATAFSAEEMSAWYRERDLLDQPRETIIDHTSSLEATVDRILADTGLAEAKAG